MKIDIYDVGHGNCAVVTLPNGIRYMIDCGLRLDPGWFPSVTFAKQHIDMVILSNLDEDHVQDLPYVWKEVSVGAIFTNPTIDATSLVQMKPDGMDEGVKFARDLIKTFGSGLRGKLPFVGDVHAWAYYNFYGSKFNNTNDLSVVTVFGWAGFTIMFASDLETEGWKSLLRIPAFVADLKRVNVLVASHHGRKSGQCDEAFDLFTPDIVIFSDDDKKYSTQETAEWYANRARGIPDRTQVSTILVPVPKRYVLTTRRDGNIQINVRTNGSYNITTAHHPQNALANPFGIMSVGEALLGR